MQSKKWTQHGGSLATAAIIGQTPSSYYHDYVQSVGYSVCLAFWRKIPSSGWLNINTVRFTVYFLQFSISERINNHGTSNSRRLFGKRG